MSPPGASQGSLHSAENPAPHGIPHFGHCDMAEVICVWLTSMSAGPLLSGAVNWQLFSDQGISRRRSDACHARRVPPWRKTT